MPALNSRWYFDASIYRISHNYNHPPAASRVDKSFTKQYGAMMVTVSRKSLFKRQKLLLALLQIFDKRLNNTDLQKYLFLFTEKHQQDKSYEFVPYRFGCFSFQSYADRRRLIEVGAIANQEDWQLLSDKNFVAELDANEQQALAVFANKYRHISGKALIQHVYQNYPYYAIHSEISSEIMNAEQRQAIAHAKPSCNDNEFFTIGYEGQSFENYLNRLIKNNIKILCDVRKNPLSRKYGFSKSALSDTLNKLDIDYIHIPELGIISDKRKNLTTQQDYNQLFDEYEQTILADNNIALDRLCAIMQQYKRVAITCFEAEHCMCHRGRVAKALLARPDWNYKISHI